MFRRTHARSGQRLVELHFLRHGKSVPRSQWSEDDASRPLTEAGVSALVHEAWTLARLGVNPEVLLTSPMERAQQTAGIVAPVLGLEGKLSTARCLGRGFGMKKLRRLLREHPRAGSIMLVGHNPEFTAVIHKLTGAHLALGKGGLARVHLSLREEVRERPARLAVAGRRARPPRPEQWAVPDLGCPQRRGRGAGSRLDRLPAPGRRGSGRCSDPTPSAARP
jgi:phosphohistidine phosphatase